jgi:uncharacterized membrane protein
MKLAAFILALVSTIFNALGQLGFKLGMNNFTPTLTDTILNLPLVLGILSYIVSLGLFMYALKRAELSGVYPVLAFTFAWVALLSTFVLHETMTALTWAGILLIALGVVSTTRGASS